MLVTLVRTRTLLRTFRLDHLPQVLPSSFWPVHSSTPTRRRGRGTSRDISLLCLSPILRPGRPRTPALFGLRPGPSRNEGFKSRRACPRLPELDHRIDGGTEKLGRRDWSIEKKALLFPLEVCQVHPQMPLHYHHGCHRPAHSSSSLLGGTEGQIHGAAQLGCFVRWRLTCCCVRLAV